MGEVCISCRPRVDVHKGGPAHVDTSGQWGSKTGLFCRRHKWMAPNDKKGHHQKFLGVKIKNLGENGPSIYDVHTEEREGVRLRWTHVYGGPAPRGRPHRKLKLESTNVILSSSHAKKLASLFTRISSLDRKSGNFSVL